MKKKFKQYEAIVFDPAWKTTMPKGTLNLHPLRLGELVYYLGDIPNVPGHCIVARWKGDVVVMVHPEDFRKAKDEEL